METSSPLALWWSLDFAGDLIVAFVVAVAIVAAMTAYMGRPRRRSVARRRRRVRHRRLLQSR